MLPGARGVSGSAVAPAAAVAVAAAVSLALAAAVAAASIALAGAIGPASVAPVAVPLALPSPPAPPTCYTAPDESLLCRETPIVKVILVLK